MFSVESIMDNLFHFKRLLWPGEIFKHISYMEIFIEKCYFMYNSIIQINLVVNLL